MGRGAKILVFNSTPGTEGTTVIGKSFVFSGRCNDSVIFVGCRLRSLFSMSRAEIQVLTPESWE